ncbi:MAG: hypothetical protein LBB50_04985 [Oscillospiraceae bacterium]|jgi:hypothetical protein|nr:hypothetical protein [Oscillospiraceae bacterium]
MFIAMVLLTLVTGSSTEAYQIADHFLGLTALPLGRVFGLWGTWITELLGAL